jgi:hypothetical protein
MPQRDVAILPDVHDAHGRDVGRRVVAFERAAVAQQDLLGRDRLAGRRHLHEAAPEALGVTRALGGIEGGGQLGEDRAETRAGREHGARGIGHQHTRRVVLDELAQQSHPLFPRGSLFLGAASIEPAHFVFS